MGFGETNLGNNNLGAKRLSNGFCTNILTYLVFQVNHKTSFHPQLVANYFLSVRWFAHVFLDHHKASFTLNAEGRRVGSHACRFHSLACISIMFVTTPLLEKCEDEIHTLKMGTWESTGTFKTSEFDCKGQNTSPWGVLYIIEKLSKHRCRKWACMSHLKICNTSYGKKKGRESN